MWLCVGLCAAVSLSNVKAGVKVGSAFPELKGLALEGKLPKTKGRVVLVDVFASWCKPCKAAFPVLDELSRKYGAKGLTVVAVSVDENPADYRRFVAKMKASFPTLLDKSHQFAAKVNPPGMPSSYIIDRQGRLRYVHRGFHGKKTRAAYIKEIETLLRE